MYSVHWRGMHSECTVERYVFCTVERYVYFRAVESYGFCTCLVQRYVSIYSLQCTDRRYVFCTMYRRKVYILYSVQGRGVYSVQGTVFHLNSTFSDQEIKGWCPT